MKGQRLSRPLVELKSNPVQVRLGVTLLRSTTFYARVLGNDAPRCSIPFFYEPRVDARIEPLEIEGALPFEPFTYGDHLWKAISEFPEFQSAERFPR